MKKILLALAAFSIFNFQFSISFAQSDPVVMEVGGRQFRQSEFMKEFSASVGDNLNRRHASEAEKREALKEYAELYANFQAKYLDALSQGQDTTAALAEELARYRKDLAAPYLIDSACLSSILKEAYERNHYVLHAAHILVHVNPDAAPEDTLEAYQRALELRQRVVNGENFADVAIGEVLRTNPKAKVQPNEGELNFFTVFDMVYPFENAVYALKEGEISMPVRTRYGYHIIKLLDRVEMYGKVTMQHIWFQGTKGRSRALAAYERLMEGTTFEMVARQSDDYTTAEKGGYLTDANMSQLPAEYVKKLSGMKEGDISKPFMTQYGWHIIRLVSKETLPPYETMEPYYKQRMTRDPRGTASRKSFATTSRKKYGVVDYTVTPIETKAKGKKKKTKEPVQMKATLDELVSQLNDSVFRGEWRVRDTAFHDLRTLVSVGDKEYNVLDVVHFIRKNKRKERRCNLGYYARTRYEEFIDSIAIAYADSQLEKENPEFAALVEEYRRGLMIFNYNDQMIWTKAIRDSVGFAKFYARESVKKSMQRPEDSVYFWRTRARIVVLDVADSACLTPAKAVKIARKALDKNEGSASMRQALLKKVSKKACKAEEPVTYSVELVEQTRQNLLGDDQWQRGVYAVPHGKGYRLLAVQEILAPCLKGQMEARGYYLNAWQNEVEETLCKELRNKYHVKINHDAINNIRL